MAEPSKVLHVRNLGPDVSEADLHQLVQNFGVPTRTVLVRTKNQALLQMPDLASAIAVMQYYSTLQPIIRGRNVYIQFSSHQELTPSSGFEKHPPPDLQPNRILLVAIHNPLYPINVDVLNQVFSPHGFVEKIITFQKNSGLQALIQYSTQNSAALARSSLQGRNIYDGCCTLEIHYSNLPELHVNMNNDRTRDFTISHVQEHQVLRGALTAPSAPLTSLFGEGAGGMYSMAPVHRQAFPQPQGLGVQGPPQAIQVGSYLQPGVSPIAAAVAAAGGSLPPGITGQNERTTIIVSNLNAETITADKLFNLFSNYGNVQRIKRLHNKPDHALVEMENGLQAELAVNYLKGIFLGGKKVEVNYSKYAHINPSPDIWDYATSSLHKFVRNAAKTYKYCCPPTRMIHCSGLPSDVTPEMITEHLSDHGTITGAKILDREGKKQALVLFESAEQATEAMAEKHGVALNGCTVRLAFSKSTSL